MVGGLFWVRFFKLVRTCSGCFSFFDCSGLCWAVLVLISFIMLCNVALAFHCCFLVVSATFSSCEVVFGSF